MTEGRADYLKLGDWNAACYHCNRKFKASELIRHWQGYYVCKAHWEPRQPQDYARNVDDVQTPGWTQPMPDAVYLDGDGDYSSGGQLCTPNGTSAVPQQAVPGCAIPGYLSSQYRA